MLFLLVFGWSTVRIPKTFLLLGHAFSGPLLREVFYSTLSFINGRQKRNPGNSHPCHSLSPNVSRQPTSQNLPMLIYCAVCKVLNSKTEGMVNMEILHFSRKEVQCHIILIN